QAASFQHWIELMKTKRYTQTRLQRMFVHILTNTKKQEIHDFLNASNLPYIRLLGLSKTGQYYLNQQKKAIDIPIYTNLNNKNKDDLIRDKRSTNLYYLALPPEKRSRLRKQEIHLPIMI